MIMQVLVSVVLVGKLNTHELFLTELEVDNVNGQTLRGLELHTWYIYAEQDNLHASPNFNTL